MWRVTNPQHFVQPIEAWDTVQNHKLGTIVRAFDEIYGEGEFIYLAGAASVARGDLCSYNGFTGVVVRGVAANLGTPLGVAMAAITASRWGWFQIGGNAVNANNATAAVDSAVFNVSAAATITSTAAAGRQVLGARIATANGSTFTKSGKTKNGSTELILSDLEGIFVGCPVSGTGVAASSVIAEGLSGQPFSNNNAVILNNAMTADGQVTITFTRTNFSVLTLNRPFAQGQIT
jgi:hypothetical protein